MNINNIDQVTAFAGETRVANGTIPQVALTVKKLTDEAPETSILVFEDATGELVYLDLSGSVEEIQDRYAPSPEVETIASAPTPTGPGRPKLGVVAREVTLLPRHWEWLNSQPGGASVALRKLVEEARRTNVGKDRIRQSQEATYRFLSAVAGDRHSFEEAIRALFAGNAARFEELIAPWPTDIRVHAQQLATTALSGQVAG